MIAHIIHSVLHPGYLNRSGFLHSNKKTIKTEYKEHFQVDYKEKATVGQVIFAGYPPFFLNKHCVYNGKKFQTQFHYDFLPSHQNLLF